MYVNAMCFIFQNLHACGGYQIAPLPVEIECFPYFFLYQPFQKLFRHYKYSSSFKRRNTNIKEELPCLLAQLQQPKPIHIIAADFNQCFIYWYRLYKIVLAVTAIIETNIKETMKESRCDFFIWAD
jgi:hypothetical protein